MRKRKPISVTATGDLWNYRDIAVSSTPIIGGFMKTFYPNPDFQDPTEKLIRIMYRRDPMVKYLEPASELIKTIRNTAKINRVSYIRPERGQVGLKFEEECRILTGEGERIASDVLYNEKSRRLYLNTGKPLDIENSPELQIRPLMSRERYEQIESIERKIADFAERLRSIPNISISLLNIGQALEKEGITSETIPRIIYLISFSKERFYLGRGEVHMEL